MIRYGFALLLPLKAMADEAIDLGDLGMDSFTPYLVERNALWIFLPAMMICLVLIHLIQPKSKGNSNDTKTP